jgi:hypothetical protein
MVRIENFFLEKLEKAEPSNIITTLRGARIST